MELQNIVLQPWLMPTYYSRYCGMYRYNKKIVEVVFAPIWYSTMLSYKAPFINRKGEYEQVYCFWVFGRNFHFPMKSTNFGQFLRKVKNVGIENTAHTKIISELIKRGHIRP